MDAKTIAKGVRIAKAALMFAVWDNDGNQTKGEVRAAIRTLFGVEVDNALADEFGAPSERSAGVNRPA